MATITVRSIKGSPLTQAEVDQNFINLNTDKLDTSGLALGSAASPSLTFTGDPNTGIYSPGADQLSVTTGGVQRLRIDSAGNVNVTTAALAQYFGINATGTAASIANGLFAPVGNTLGFVTNATERARIDTSGRLLVGTSTARSNYYGSITPTGIQNEIGFGTFFANTAAATGSAIYMGKSRGTAAGSNTVVQSGDQLGGLVFFGADGTNPQPGAQITAEVDGTPGLNDMPGRLVFSTTADGAATPTERMRITSTGQVGINRTPGGAIFLDVEGPIRSANGTIDVRLQAGAGGAAGVGSFSSDALILIAAGIERARIDTSGRLLVGTSSSITGLFSNAAAVQFNASLGTQALALTRFSANNFGADIDFLKSRNATVGAHTIVQSGDQIANLNFAGSDGTAFVAAAGISANIDGTPGANDMPGRLVFSTTADGAASPTERLRITNDGVQAYNQPAPAAVNATATLTAANLKAGIITSTSAAATDMTLPTGTDTQAGFSGTYDNMTFEWSVINTGPSLVRVLAGTAHTVVGSGSVLTGTSGRFASRRTAANTFVTYRLS